MEIEKITEENTSDLTKMFLALWPDCSFDEELENCKRIHNSAKETAFLVKQENNYIAFIYLSLKYEHVEGTSTSPVAYIEGLYVKPEYRRSGIGKQLIEMGEAWGKEKGCREYASDAEIQNELSIIVHLKAGFKEVNRVVCFRKAIQ